MTGRSEGSPYTRATVETGTLGKRRLADFDALYAEAKRVLGQSVEDLAAVTARLRSAHAADVADRTPPASDAAGRAARDERLAGDRAVLQRLELIGREVEQNLRFLERGAATDWSDALPGATDEPNVSAWHARVALQLLEAREQERSIVAEELHDGPAQGMANAIFQVDILDRTLRSDPQAARTELMALRGELDRELERLRGFMHQLHPSMQADDGLEQAVGELAQRMARDSGIEVEVSMTAPVDMLDAPRTRAVLRVAQEALRNVRKHASASHVRLSTFLEPVSDASAHAPRWILEIADNGRGFPVEEVLDQTSKRHFGLRFMRERAQLIGARLEIVSNPAAGTTVRLALEPAKRS